MSREAGSEVPEAARLIIVAHPDDEALWLEPWLSADSLVLVAFPNHPREPSITEARQQIRAEFPYGTMDFLPLQSLDVLGRSDWRRRAPSAYGVELSRDCPPDIRQAYVENYHRLCEVLAPYLAAHSVVYTHNPWGEYGHEEHIQLCRAVLDTGKAHRTSVWAWDGLSPSQLARSSMRLRRDYFERGLTALPRVTRELDAARYRELKGRYEAAAAWTWDAGYIPPASMDYIELMHDGKELAPPSAPRRGVRAAGILGGHLRSTPRVARRLVSRGRIRSG
jgi:hypothetical protein